jgi:hypothetical protein
MGDAQSTVRSAPIQQLSSEFPGLDFCNASVTTTACANTARARKQFRLPAYPDIIQQHGGPP